MTLHLYSPGESRSHGDLWRRGCAVVVVSLEPQNFGSQMYRARSSREKRRVDSTPDVERQL